jgi:hypothetical protein
LSTILAQEPNIKHSTNPLITSTDKRQGEVYFSPYIFWDMNKHFLITTKKTYQKLQASLENIIVVRKDTDQNIDGAIV